MTRYVVTERREGERETWRWVGREDEEEEEGEQRGGEKQTNTFFSILPNEYECTLLGNMSIRYIGTLGNLSNIFFVFYMFPLKSWGGSSVGRGVGIPI